MGALMVIKGFDVVEDFGMCLGVAAGRDFQIGAQ